MNRITTRTIAFVLLFAPLTPAFAAETKFIVPSSQRQLFLDDVGIAEMHGLRRTMHSPRKLGAVLRSNPALTVDALQIRSAPMWNPALKRFCWVDCTGPNDLHARGIACSGYHESDDGLHWCNPAVGLVERAGSKNNHWVTVKINGQHARPDCSIFDPLDPALPYKGLALIKGGVQPIASADAKTWIKLEVPIIPSSDEFNLSFDPVEKQFLATVKQRGPHGRSVFLSTSKDFRHWSKPELIFHADDQDQELGRETIRRRFADPSLQHPIYNDPKGYNVDVYNMGVFRYEGLYIGMPALYYATGKLPTVNTDGFHLIQLASSRDLRHWQRLGNRQPFIGPSPLGAGAYDQSELLPPSSPILMGDELWFYYTGIKFREVPPNADPDHSAACLAVLRRDGFVSLDAGKEEGSVRTKSFVLPKGELHLNAQVNLGQVVVKVLDDKGTTIPGFEASEPVKGDQLRAPVRWPSGKKLADLHGQKASLHFKVSGAQLYAYWLQ